jgi:prepilin-type N-terminal cleavage/methylation domain-containing protein
MENNNQVVGRCSSFQNSRAGTTLVELLAAVAILCIMAMAIYLAGGAVLRHAQTVTIATAAHMYAKEGLEEAIAAGYETLTGGELIEQEIMVNPHTHHVDLIRTPTVIWHAFDGSVSANPVAGGYAEVVVRVSWTSPRTGVPGSVAISTLVF